ncbi:vWA domain-containing protein [Methylomicrobium sp. Wu6]|uniref:vWA domain-containing protein n=1 Tax=Methylomicrobium sp. Wu6 TaxID=3107928 RepID=UPI002DD67A5C|nr:vWA domain-containing protein [Methylomicrobium sp. Wu6]MEC4746981.1 vWA domain-containing protein [Methylomicrobium sp. Wu6]
MKTKLLTLGLFAATAATIAFYPVVRQATKLIATPPTAINPITIPPVAAANQRPQIEVVFVLDTTGSMSGLIAAAKEKIWSIAGTMASAQSAPDIKMGLVAYRDRGDAYIAQTIPLSSDLDSMYAKLMDFQADGGGDGPESVNQALYDAVNKITWSPNPTTYKVIFLVGDAPPHMDYQDDVKYPVTVALAKQKGIIVNAIQCGQDSNTNADWRQVASLGQGSYFQVEQSGSAVAIATPYDKKLAELSAKWDKTRVFYGNDEEKAKQASKMAATEKLHKEASTESQARRATFNASASGKANFLGENELVDAISSGRVKLSNLPKKSLPESLQAMSPAAQEEFVGSTKKERSELESEIKILSKQRNDYLRQKVVDEGGKKDSLDAKLFGAIRKQANNKGLVYEADSAKY